ncbi:hypothetical protein [Burkholderia multivorans]|uniref:hypothetical protein n=1 Tax=Burkholderia multivorans TaxID=87883 RepID=UPI0020190912|nr:hypothetical protein [Burkholderia multivorans]MCA8143493.1 hypothetical protein [Burkholderia multivorans]MCO1368503.1 hypothetical protein [Burkholderia multivorans]MCO1380394.1 hypothetical protein [Burkholderia multivorans]MDN8032837.1 hypothetical protein [Burkholderia multivorans]UQP21495.1 hypothetical protein L0Y98_18725 [Burkholderia multivorans]
MTYRSSLSRRAFLSSVLTTGAALGFALHARRGFAANTGVCTASAEQVLGPYYLDKRLVRRDIREHKPGVPLQLRFTVIALRGCVPLADALVDVWQCDALGVYSGFGQLANSRPPAGTPHGPPPFGLGPAGANHGPPPGRPPAPRPTDAFTFLRGVQPADRDGTARFDSIVPGVYPGRTNHVHFRVRSRVDASHGDHVAYTGQVFFPEALIAPLMRNAAPYRDNRIARVALTDDPIFASQHGAQAVAHTTLVDSLDPVRGVVANVIVTIDPGAISRESG